MGSRYKIKEYSFDRAKQLNVEIKPSSNPKKKIDVFKDNKKIESIGAVGYFDFPTLINVGKGLEYANKRRRLYKKRHEKDRHIVGSNGFWSDKILW